MMAWANKRNITINIENPYNVFNKQIYDNLYNYNNFTEVYWGGASSGKSAGVIQKLVIKALGNWKKPRRILVTRKVSTTIYDSIFADVIDCLSSFGILQYCVVNKSSYRITLPNGSQFIFKGLDDPEKIKSIKGLSDIFMEEASEFTYEDYNQLTLRLRDKAHKNKQIFLAFNPVSKANWVYKQFFLNKPKRTQLFQSNYKDNHFLDEETIENIEDMKNRDMAYYRIYGLGEFATLDKLVFPNYEARLLNKDSEKLKELPSYFALDFGYINDPSAFIHVKLDKDNKKLYVVETFTKKGMLNDEIAQMIKDLGYSKEVVTADSAEKKSIEEIKREGIRRIKPAKKGPDSINQGIQHIKQYDLIVDERCTDLIEELENYTWQKDRKSNEYINKPIDAYNHLIDALRYSLEETMNKSKWLV